MENLPVTQQATSALVTARQSLFFDVAKFDHAQRVAKMLVASTIVPEHFRNNLGNCMIALNYAERVGADPFMVMQNMYVVHGKPGLEGKLTIALVNQCGRFGPLEFIEDKNSCVAQAKELKSGKLLKGPAVTMEIVKGEGWLDKKGSKWKTMPQLMFRYRAAAFFARTYCPEVMLGMQTVEEINDFVDLKQTGPATYETAEVEKKQLYADEDKLAYLKIIKSAAHELEIEDRVAGEHVNKFAAECADAQDMDIDEFKKSAVDNREVFEAEFYKWHNRTYPKPEKTLGNASRDATEAETETPGLGNWWNDSANWKHKRGENFEHLFRLGLGLKCRPCFPGDELLPEQITGGYAKMKKNNPGAVGTLNAADNATKADVKAKMLNATSNEYFQSIMKELNGESGDQAKTEPEVDGVEKNRRGMIDMIEVDFEKSDIAAALKKHGLSGACGSYDDYPPSVVECATLYDDLKSGNVG